MMGESHGTTRARGFCNLKFQHNGGSSIITVDESMSQENKKGVIGESSHDEAYDHTSKLGSCSFIQQHARHTFRFLT